MEKKFKRTTVTSGTAVCERTCTHRSPGRRICTGRYLCALSATEERRCIVYRRFGRTRVPITIRAKKRRRSLRRMLVDRYHYLIKKSFEEFGVSFDVYSRTTSKTHHELASDFFKTLYNKGEFIEKTSEQYYDEEAKTFLADRYITGECPHAIRKVPMATNARNAEPPVAHRSESTRRAPSAWQASL